MPRTKTNPTTDTEAVPAVLDGQLNIATNKPIETLESVPMLSIQAAFIKFQQLVPKIVKEGKGNYGQYVTLDELIGKARPILNELGFSLSQDVYTDELGFYNIVTKLTYVTGEIMQTGELRLSVEGLGMQKLGSAITYGRRYQIGAFLGLVVDMDDNAQTAQDTTDENVGKPKVIKPNQYIQYIEGISQWLGVPVDETVYTMDDKQLVTVARDLKGQKEAKEKEAANVAVA